MPASKKKNEKQGVRTFRLRMYRHGLGDCFLLSFPKMQGGEFHILIDCGLIAVATEPQQKMLAVAEDVASATAGHLDLVVLTHEHWDHVSGFSEYQAKSVFDSKLKIDRVWYAWTEDPNNKLGRKLRRERELKARAVHRAVKAFSVQAPRIASLLTFFGIENAYTEALAADAKGTIGKVRRAFDYLGQRTGIQVRYCYPTDSPWDPPGVEGVRVYVLGPPENEGLIKRSDPTVRGKEVYEIVPGTTLEENLLAAFSRFAKDAMDVPTNDRDSPFDAYLQRQPGDSSALNNLMSQTWNVADQMYRNIDTDWMNAAETLSLALDKHTNNTSLVLAFELLGTGRVLLFAADAQVGNWLSWQDLVWTTVRGNEKVVVTGPDLLRRTVVYKVGHHGSHNATLRDRGLELMESRELIALVPVNKAEAVKNGWNEMPFEKLVERLREKARGRVIMSDSEIPSQLDPLTPEEQNSFTKTVRSTAQYHELELPL